MPNIEKDMTGTPRKDLHVFYVLDTSGSMSGDKISTLNRAIVAKTLLEGFDMSTVYMESTVEIYEGQEYKGTTTIRVKSSNGKTASVKIKVP